MDAGIMQYTAQYVERMIGKEDFRHVSIVVANCKLLALQLGSQDSSTLDVETLVLAGYLHTISTGTYGYQGHQTKSAEMAVQFLQQHAVPMERIRRVHQAILAYATASPTEQDERFPLEGRILYDADKLGQLSGLAVVTSLIEFGTRFPNKAFTSEVLCAILHHIEERFVDLYQSLNTEPARVMAKESFDRTLAFLDGVIEHLADVTPV